METTELSAEIRTRTGKEGSGQTRRSGSIPAVLYGGSQPPQPISVSENEFQKALRASGNQIPFLHLKVKETAGETSSPAIIKAVQRHPVNESIIHIDFQRVSLTEKMTVEVPIRVEGTAPGLKFGGIIQQPLRTVRVHCLPANIPQSVVADVSEMQVGDVLNARDLKLPPDVELQTDPDLTILSIVVIHYQEEETAPTAEATAAAAETPAQPEVIGEKERDERRLKKSEEKEKREAEKAEIKETQKAEEKKK